MQKNENYSIKAEHKVLILSPLVTSSMRWGLALAASN